MDGMKLDGMGLWEWESGGGGNVDVDVKWFAGLEKERSVGAD